MRELRTEAISIRRADLIFIFALALGIWVAYLVRDVLLLIYVSVLFAVVITPAIQLVQRIRIGTWHPGRGLAMVVILLGGLVLLALFVAFALPPIFRDVQALAAEWPHRAADLSRRMQQLPLAKYLDVASLQQHMGSAVGGIFGLFRGIAGGVFWFFSWLILTVYFFLDGERAFHWLMSLVPARQRNRLEPTLLRAEARVRHWLIGQAALMLILGSCSAVVFGLLHIRYFYALAVFAGVANIVPIIGPLVSLVLAGMVAAVDSWTKLAGVLVFYFVYQQVENAFLTPRIMKSTLDLPALAVIIALSIGGALAGVLGALVAVPTAAVAAVFIEEYLVRPNREEVGFTTQPRGGS